MFIDDLINEAREIEHRARRRRFWMNIAMIVILGMTLWNLIATLRARPERDYTNVTEWTQYVPK